MLRRQRITSASSLSVSGRELVPSSWVVVGSVLETLGSRGVSDWWLDPVCFGTESLFCTLCPLGEPEIAIGHEPRIEPWLPRNRIACQVSRIGGRCHHSKNEPRERKSNPEKDLSSDREPSANSGLDIETKIFSATSRRRSFFVDIPFYRTTYLKMKRSIMTKAFWEGFQGVSSSRVGLPSAPQDLGRKPSSH